MITSIYIPVYPLNQFIDNFFYYSGFHPEHSVDRFLPDGEVQIIFDLTDEPKFIYDNYTLEEIQSCRKAWFSGFRTEPITIPSGRESEMLIVQFKKGKVFPFLKEPMHFLTNIVLDAELVLKKEIVAIRESLGSAKMPLQKFKILEVAILDCYLSHLNENPFIDFAISKIIASPSQYSIRAISEKVGYSQKHMIKMFKEYVGVTPKEFLKVIRFQKAIEQIARQVPVDWFSIAYDCGYYDQSHFISDFKKFSGYTPTEYLQQRGDFPNYVPIK